MFRNVYKSANDEIKGDRALLENVYARAYAPKKKVTPIYKYSFATTAVAAVIVAGAVFANLNLFTDKVNNIPKQNIIENETEEIVYIQSAVTKESEDEIVEVHEGKVTNEVTAAVQEPDTKSKKVEKAVPAESANEGIMVANADCEYPVNEEVGISVIDIEDSDYAAYEGEIYTEAAVMWGRRVLTEESENDDAYYDEAETELTVSAKNTVSLTASGGETAEADEVKAFSYMYESSIYTTATEDFKNTDISPITNADEAIDRAKNEYEAEYIDTLVYYDMAENMWKVSFICDEDSESSVNVYINADGITQMIVYCE